MDLLSWTPASALFWGGLAVMTWASWMYRHRPEIVLRWTAYPSGSIGDQAEIWLRNRSQELS